MEYPEKLHKKHNAFILAPEQRTITFDELSPYSKHVYAALNEGKKNYKANKLTASFFPRKNYVVHFANLKFYLKQGLILKKVHRVLSFKQSHFLKVYIDFCTERRAESKTSFSKSVWKLLANAW